MSPRLEVRAVLAVSLRYEPGNGTSYRILVTQDTQGGAGWMWLEGTKVWASGWFGGEDIRYGSGKLGKADRAALADLLSLEPAQGVLAENYRLGRGQRVRP